MLENQERNGINGIEYGKFKCWKGISKTWNGIKQKNKTLFIQSFTVFIRILRRLL